MNKIKNLSVCLLVLLAGCRMGMEGKLESAVKKMEQKKYEANGEKLESISIDSLKYEPASMQNFYSDEADKQVNVLDVYSNRLQEVIDTSTVSMKEVVKAKAQKQLEIFNQLQSLSLSADSAKNLYSVEYRLKARTNKNSYDARVQKYLYKDGLKEVTLDGRYVSEAF